MAFDETAARAVARLARLELGDERSGAAMAAEFAKIVGYMDILAEAETEGVEPLYSPMLDPQPARPDEPRQGPGRADEILAQAPERIGRFFAVPRVV